jgi:cytoskeleton protein RodZ
MIKQGMSVGQSLQGERESKKISLETVAQKTRISPAYLKALEKDAFQLLPAEFYVCGFLRSYAKFIHLDPGEILDLYHHQVKPAEDTIRKMVVRKSSLQSMKDHLLDFLVTVGGGSPTYSIGRSLLPPKH